jgi:hypothetical protein
MRSPSWLAQLTLRFCCMNSCVSVSILHIVKSAPALHSLLLSSSASACVAEHSISYHIGWHKISSNLGPPATTALQGRHSRSLSARRSAHLHSRVPAISVSGFIFIFIFIFIFLSLGFGFGVTVYVIPLTVYLPRGVGLA